MVYQGNIKIIQK